MSISFTFQNSSHKVHQVSLDGTPWFRGNDVATILGYAAPRYAIRDHVPEKCKNTLEKLMLASGRGDLPLPDHVPEKCKSALGNLMLASGSAKSPLLDHNDKISVFISEAGLYRLVSKSKAKFAEAFTDWVCSEVLPQIRKTGSYSLPGHYSSNNITWGEVHRKAIGREDELHYKVTEHIRSAYPDAVITPGLGEHHVTDHQRMDSYLKGYATGQPDIMVIKESQRKGMP